MKKFQLAPGLKIGLFAEEPTLMNPVSFSIDEHGRFFIAETHRYKDSIFDITQNQPWLLNDLSFRKVADRAVFLAKTFATNASLLTRDSEVVRLLEDRSGGGRADTSLVYADGFRESVSGPAAGILARHGEVWTACIPDLWRLQGTDASGRAVKREKLHTGFGVHIGVTGHDLHGLRLGPDGKLYMSSGDRGFVVRTKEGNILNSPDTGGVLRCNPDGSDLEVVCIGMRNPQELAFDQYGNLFTDDNDTAGEDRSRVIYVVEGADYGWRCSYQHMSGFGPWNKEKVWMGNIDDALPWCGYVSQGPAGLTFYPGTGLPAKYQNHFLVCDFPGGVRSFAVKPKGASYETVENEKFLWNLWPTDVEFGPDSCVYVSDWVAGWQMPDKGRLYRIWDPAQTNNPAIAEVKQLLGDGMDSRPMEELARLLTHADMRVRIEAQYALAARGTSAIPMLARVATENTNQLARLHAIWGLGQLARKSNAACEPLIPLLADADTEVRAQAAKVLGDARYQKAFDALLHLLTGPRRLEGGKPVLTAQTASYAEPRPKFFAAMALAKLKNRKSIAPILEMLRENNDRDAYLTHAGMRVLLELGDTGVIQRAAKDKSPAVRRAAMLCLRRRESPAIAEFLKDSAHRIVVETARAINDVPINAAMPQLAAMLGAEHQTLWNPDLRKKEWDADERVGKSLHAETGWRHVLPHEQLLLRAINANYRLGAEPNARALADFAGRDDAPPTMRVAALEALADWAKPSPIDRVMGLWRPLPSPRDATIAAKAVSRQFANYLKSPDATLATAAIRCAAKLGLTAAGPELLALFQKPGAAASVKVEILDALAELKDARLEPAVELALADANEEIRRAGIRMIARVDLPNAAAMLDKLLSTETDARMGQAAFDALGRIKNPKADAVIANWLEQLRAGKVRPELQLDLLEAAANRPDAAVTAALKQYEQGLKTDDEFCGYREVLQGGDAAEGRKIFVERAGVECSRCHAIQGKGGVVGPDLAGIGARQTREYLLESILFPNQRIAQGFENVTVTLKGGRTVAGLLKSESDKELVLNSPEDGIVKVARDQIESRQRGLSAMPEGMGRQLSKRDLRNLVEFLAGLK